MILRGVIETGVGSFGYWITKLHDYYFQKTGLLLYPGTLNVRLSEPFELPEQRIRLEANEYGGTVSVNIVSCSILGHQAVILRTDKNDTEKGEHARTVIEIATDIGLRDTYGLRDGDWATIEIPDSPEEILPSLRQSQ